MVSYFSKLNYECPTIMNPADFYSKSRLFTANSKVDLITVDNRTPEAEVRTKAILDTLVDSYTKTCQHSQKKAAKVAEEATYYGGASFLLQVAISQPL